MDYWERICGVLSNIFEANKDLNFNIRLNPQEVSAYLEAKVFYARMNSTDPTQIEAALFVTIDGECGFIASKASLSSYKYLINEFNEFVLKLPDDLRKSLWCKVQKNNHKVQRLVNKLGFSLDKETENALYYVYKGGN